MDAEGTEGDDLTKFVGKVDVLLAIFCFLPKVRCDRPGNIAFNSGSSTCRWARQRKCSGACTAVPKTSRKSALQTSHSCPYQAVLCWDLIVCPTKKRVEMIHTGSEWDRERMHLSEHEPYGLITLIRRSVKPERMLSTQPCQQVSLSARGCHELVWYATESNVPCMPNPKKWFTYARGGYGVREGWGTCHICGFFAGWSTVQHQASSTRRKIQPRLLRFCWHKAHRKALQWDATAWRAYAPFLKRVAAWNMMPGPFHGSQEAGQAWLFRFWYWSGRKEEGYTSIWSGIDTYSPHT